MARTPGRPKGLRLSRPALDDILDGRKLSEVAREHKLPTSTIYGIAAGDQGATVATATRLAEALGVDVRTLFPELWLREMDVAA